MRIEYLLTGKNMTDFTPSEISNWADKAEANFQFPQLIRELIRSTVPKLSCLDMPSGRAVWGAGWDGIVGSEMGNQWVPEGDSGWELSCQRKIGNKARNDYKKRTKDPLGLKTETTTFVFVTPHQWNNKTRWVKKYKKRGEWADVCAYDARDLACWLNQAPDVAMWFAYLIGKFPANGFIFLEEWWKNWTSVSKPLISPELVLAGRQEMVDKLAECIQQPNISYYVQAQTREEAIAFVASALKQGTWGTNLLAKTLVVQSEDAWNSILSYTHTLPLILVRDFDGNVSSHLATEGGHTVITPVYRERDCIGEGIRLPTLLGYSETLTALVDMGMGKPKAQQLMRKTARRLTIIRRCLLDEAGHPPPSWAEVGPRSLLPSLMLLGQWDQSNENDKAIISEITGQSYENVERELVAIMQNEESPLIKMGNHWRFISYEEVWYLIAPLLTESLVEQFKKVAIQILETESTVYELPIEKRYMAPLLGKGLPHSNLLRAGIFRTLALMGNLGERAKQVNAVPYLPGSVLRQVLTSSKGWQIWASLDRNLIMLAEAAPEAIMEAIEQCLVITPCPFKTLLTQEASSLLPTASHTGLLWALKRLAWTPEYFSRVACIFAQLSMIDDPGGSIINRPMNSLKGMFLPSIRFAVSDTERLDTLEMLLKKYPKPSWKMLHELLQDQSVENESSSEECQTFLDKLEMLFLKYVGNDMKRWTNIFRLPLITEKKAIAQLVRLDTHELRQQPNSDQLWKILRFRLNQHRSYPDAPWAMTIEKLEPLESVYQALTPNNPAEAQAWLFDGHPYFPDGNSIRMTDDLVKIDRARRKAITEVYNHGGNSAVLSIIGHDTDATALGQTFAEFAEVDHAQTLAVKLLSSDRPKYQEMARGILGKLLQQEDWPFLEKTIDQLKSQEYEPIALANIFLATPPTQHTWERLNSEASEVQRLYWLKMEPGKVLKEEKNIELVTDRLLSVQRSIRVAQWILGLSVNYKIVIRTLEQLPFDLVESKVAINQIAYLIVELLKQLDESDEVGNTTIARLELPLIPVISRKERFLAIDCEIAKEPSLFASLIASAYKPDDGHSEAYSWEILERFILDSGKLPGQQNDADIDQKLLFTWVHECRRLCTDQGLGEIGEECIGRLLAKSPTGHDGIWPCEPVRNLLDDIGSQEIENGFIIGKLNLRGVTTRGAFEGGSQEYKLEDYYRSEAEKIRSTWPFTAKLLLSLAREFQQEGKRFDLQADEQDQFESY